MRTVYFAAVLNKMNFGMVAHAVGVLKVGILKHKEFSIKCTPSKLTSFRLSKLLHLQPPYLEKDTPGIHPSSVSKHWSQSRCCFLYHLDNARSFIVTSSKSGMTGQLLTFSIR